MTGAEVLTVARCFFLFFLVLALEVLVGVSGEVVWLKPITGESISAVIKNVQIRPASRDDLRIGISCFRIERDY